LGQIDIEKNPAPPGFGAGDDSAFGAGTQHFRIHTQKLGCFLKIEGFHGVVGKR
jgi:hypothetical protein